MISSSMPSNPGFGSFSLPVPRKTGMPLTEPCALNHYFTPEKSTMTSRRAFSILLLAAMTTHAGAGTNEAPSTHELADINWMEFRELVPTQINTIILPTGTIEPHGVINNGADITPPVPLARKIAPPVN